ncbi:14 kDa proline-rich protein DC2.15-like [Apium graveolens]|uniref:14 kDa proline-rich protein DC2.15-like n=1 Tax=Apium graveolens TaxID=4045 RepID=UPI003D79A418
MASQSNATTALLLSINILFFSLVSSSEMSPSPEPEVSPSPPDPEMSPSPPEPERKPSPPPRSPNAGKCPRNALKLGVCADILQIIKGVVIGAPPTQPCCSLLKGLINLEAAVCLCTAIKANILGIIKLNVPVDLSLVLNNCGKQVPNGYECR